MCIKQVEAWEHGGKLFSTERQALDAALSDIGARIVKEHHASPATGLLANKDAILRVLGRIDELGVNVGMPIAAEPAARFVDDAVAEAA
jgi:hypothetical protein